MTNEEAIKTLRELWRNTNDPWYEKVYEMAISALTAQPETHEERTETHACDLISRQALCEYALNQKDKSITPNDIMRFPSAQPVVKDINVPVNVNDCISRQAAIDALARMMPRSYTPDGSHPADEEIFRAQEVFADCIEALEILPPVQPEIIRCRDCKHRTSYWGNCKLLEEKYHQSVLVGCDEFCSMAERRTDVDANT